MSASRFALAASTSVALLTALRAARRAARSSSALCASLAPAPVPSEPVKVALCQLSVGSDKAANVASACRAVAEAARAGAALVVLPEMFSTPYDNACFPSFAEDLATAPVGCVPGAGSPTARALSEAARAARVTLVGGSLPEACGGKLYNTCLVFGADGTVLARHRKLHLFDVCHPPMDGKPGLTFRESDTLSAGEAITVVDTPAGRLAIGICFDLRFPELALLAARRGAQILVYPGAFNLVSGPVHWELLARARAVDTQAFVLLCSPARSADGVPGYKAWGHSVAVGPFGEVLATTDEREGTVVASLDLSQLAARRAAMPLAQQRRGDVYELVDRTK
jgi:omega-amidase